MLHLLCSHVGKLCYMRIYASCYACIWIKKHKFGKKAVGMCACLAVFVILDSDASTKTMHR